jgi:hypothetical protein
MWHYVALSKSFIFVTFEHGTMWHYVALCGSIKKAKKTPKSPILIDEQNCNNIQKIPKSTFYQTNRLLCFMICDSKINSHKTGFNPLKFSPV